MANNDKNSPEDGSQYEKIGEFVAIFVRGKSWYANYQHAGKQIRKSLKTQSKKEARRRALLIEKEILAGDYKHHQRAPSIAEVIEQYLAHLRSEGRASKTIGKYEYCFKLLQELATRTKKTLLSQVDVALVDLYRAERAAGEGNRRPGSAKTVHNDTVTIRQLVNFARRRGMIQDDPLRALKIKKPKRTPQPWWTRDQVQLILGASRSPHREPLTFLAETGVRIGEAKWLTWEDVDFTSRLIHIRPKEGWRPKTGDERVVPMTDRVRDMLAKMPRAENWVFTARVTKRHSDYGRQISERRLLQYLKRILKRLKLKGHLHTFRHSFISHAALHNVPERVLRRWVGHVDRQILDWYFHLADAQSHEEMQRLSQADQRKSKGA